MIVYLVDGRRFETSSLDFSEALLVSFLYKGEILTLETGELLYIETLKP